MIGSKRVLNAEKNGRYTQVLNADTVALLDRYGHRNPSETATLAGLISPTAVSAKYEDASPLGLQRIGVIMSLYLRGVFAQMLE